MCVIYVSESTKILILITGMLKEVTHNNSEGDLFLTSMKVMINLTLTEGSKSGFDIFTVRFLINSNTCHAYSD